MVEIDEYWLQQMNIDLKFKCIAISYSFEQKYLDIKNIQAYISLINFVADEQILIMRSQLEAF